MTAKVTLALLAALFATASALPLYNLEEWTNAIQLNQTEKVKELLQTPRHLLSQAQEKVQKIQEAQNNFKVDLAGYLVANKTIDKRAGWDVLEKFANKWFSLSFNSEIEDASEWFEFRCSDAVTPVSGDLRVLLEKAKNGFLHELQYLNSAWRGFSRLRKGLEPLVTRDDPEARKEAIQLVDTFFSYFEHGLSTQTLSHVSPAIDDFYRLWSEKKSGKGAGIHETAIEDWKKALQAADKQKVSDLIEVPRSLIKKAYEKGKLVWDVVGPLQLEFGKFILNDTVDREAAFSLLSEATASLSQLDLDYFLLEAKEWFNERSCNEVTPVSGDARALFQRASDATHKQRKDMNTIRGEIGEVWYQLGSLLEAEGPEAEKQIRFLWPAFYAGIGLRNGSDALSEVDDDLTNFLKYVKSS